MTLTGVPRLAPNGVRAFDCNDPLTPAQCSSFRAAGYRAAIRYVPRVIQHDYDLTPEEAERILKAGLALGIVQHVAPENWMPTARLGADYGHVAAMQAQFCGVPMGVNIWCDLEGVKLGTAPADIIGFLNSWWMEVAHFGYLPGLYVGWHAGLTAQQLFSNLRFQYYWSAYNLNADQVPAVRGVCMKQGTELRLAGMKFDPDVCTTDQLGNRATFLAPSDLWPE